MWKHISRHQSRDLALKVVFLMSERVNQDWKEAFEYVKDEFFPDLDDEEDFAKNIVQKTLENKDRSQKLISKYASSFTIDKTNPMDICILENLITEIFYLDNSTPVPVAINEALLLASDYWKEWSIPFVNWVIAKIIKDNEKISKKN